MRGQRGIALISAIMISFLLLTVGIGFLSFMERDAHFQAAQEYGNRAFYLARSGLELFHFHDIQNPDTVFPPNSAIVLDVSPREHIEVTKMPGRCKARGFITTESGTVLAQRVLYMPTHYPGGNENYTYEEGQ